MKDVNQIERVQRTFTRFVMKKCCLPKISYESRLRFFSLDSLVVRRAKTDLILLYKMYYGLVDLPLSRFFPPCNDRQTVSRGNGRKLPHPYTAYDNDVNNYFSNSLSRDCVTAASIDVFRCKIDSLDLARLLVAST